MRRTPLLFALMLCMSAAQARNIAASASIDHIAIEVADARKEARFYQDIFGFKELKTPFVGHDEVIWLDLDYGVALHIFGGRPRKAADARERHLAFNVTHLDRIIDMLKARDIQWQDFDGHKARVQTRPDGVRQMFFQDPEGYWIEVNERPAS